MSLPLLSLLLACGGPPQTSEGAASETALTERELAQALSLSPLPALPPSPSNRVADDPAAAALGRALFFDARMSSNGEVSCASCHQPARHFTDGERVAKGVGVGKRNTPTLIGGVYSSWQFWDGRADTLWSQALGPIESPLEHGLDRVRVAHLVFNHHRAAYEAIFGPMPPMDDRARFPEFGRPWPGEPQGPDHQAWIRMAEADQGAVNEVFANVGKALEAFQRTLTPQPSSFDRYVAARRAGDATGGGHLSAEAERGLKLFVGEASCVLCHNGPNLADDAFHSLGLPTTPSEGLDMGRAVGARLVLSAEFNCAGPYSDTTDCPELRYLNPEFPDFILAFKTPSLRHVAQTAPYMHDGRFKTLDEVLNFYSTLPGEPPLGHRELTLKPLKLSPDELSALTAFLESLSAPAPEVSPPSPS
ncbi:cytochrome-c peroxidase [Myxococcota bacterium]|nr:cytochrome-c peroxidase [Myxococcota bacterium]